jgi:hypothetical protein
MSRRDRYRRRDTCIASSWYIYVTTEPMLAPGLALRRRDVPAHGTAHPSDRVEPTTVQSFRMVNKNQHERRADS